MKPIAAALVVLLASIGTAQTRLRVAVVPAVNVSGEKWAELKQKQADKINEYAQEAFSKAGYDVVPLPEVARALAEGKVDFTDEEQQKRSVLFELGKRLHADYILLSVITSTEQKQTNRVFYEDREGRTDVKLWFLDVRSERAILSAKTFVGRSGGNRTTFKPSDRQIQAAANAVRDGLKPFFSGQG